MIPRGETELWIDDPHFAAGLPAPSEAMTAGFRDENWEYEPGLLGATWDDAKRALEVERERVGLADAGSSSPSEFEDLVDGDLEDWELDAVWGLDVGVAAAVLSLIASGCVTTTSCRGHVGRFASGHDIARVRFMADVPRATLVRDAAVAARCGFGVEPPIVEVFAPSVTEMLEFAQRMIDSEPLFKAWERPDYYLDHAADEF